MTTAVSGSAGSLSGQAASLAEQIRRQGRQADQLSEQADRAQIRLAQIADQLRGTQASLTQTSAMLSRASSTLAHQAVAAYMQGGRQPLTYVVNDTADDRSLINGYASAVAGLQQRDVVAYQHLRKQQSDQAQALSTAQSSAVASLQQLQAAQQAAQAVGAQEQTTLDGVMAQPQLTTLVVAAEASQYQATASVVQARFASGASSPTAGSDRSSGRSSAGAVSAGRASAGTVSPGAGSGRTNAGAISAGTGSTGADATSRAGATSGATTGAISTGTGPTVAGSPGPTNTTPVAVPSPSSHPAPTPTPVTSAPVTTVASRPVVPTAPSPPPAPPSGVSAAIAYAYAQIGKPYQWGGAGPSSFDCSGLVMEAYQAAGIGFDHLAQDRYNSTARVAINALRPGDLVFFGSPADVYHVGIYVGGGSMVDAPHAGADVRVEGIYWSDLFAGGRVR
ncbi:MAG: NlpC/P60 family protein [Actinomycetota bacterium]|nr:NlpC/P60 family protein [Actinomycetota bacterium]